MSLDGNEANLQTPANETDYFNGSVKQPTRWMPTIQTGKLSVVSSKRDKKSTGSLESVSLGSSKAKKTEEGTKELRGEDTGKSDLNFKKAVNDYEDEIKWAEENLDLGEKKVVKNDLNTHK